MKYQSSFTKILVFCALLLINAACTSTDERVQGKIEEARKALSQSRIRDANMIAFQLSEKYSQREDVKALNKAITDVRVQGEIEEARKALSEKRINDAVIIAFNLSEQYKGREDVKALDKAVNESIFQEVEESISQGRLDRAIRQLGDIRDKKYTYDITQRALLRMQEVEERYKHTAKGKKEYERKKGGLIGFRWVKGGFDTAAIINSITIRNTSDTECRDIRGVMIFSTRSGTELGRRSFTIYDIIPPNKTKTFRYINVGFMPSPSDQITNANVEIFNCQ